MVIAAAHMVMWAMSDRGIPRSYRMMQGFGVNTFTLINAKGDRHFVKFHYIPELGVNSLMWDEALKINGQDPGAHSWLLKTIDLNMYGRFSSKGSRGGYQGRCLPQVDLRHSGYS